jgi:hypothetical protein
VDTCRWALVGVLSVHGLIHVMGFVKAFGYAELPHITQLIARSRGVLWLLAAGLIITNMVLLTAGARSYWTIGCIGLTPVGIEMIVGVVQDPLFVPLIACGTGGIFVDLLADTAFRLAPAEQIRRRAHDQRPERRPDRARVSPGRPGGRGCTVRRAVADLGASSRRRRTSRNWT